jgi:hypothetical protein
VTTEIQGACGIVAGYPRLIDISHNEISNTNYTGISVGFGWTTAANAMSNNKINNNDVHHIEKIMADDRTGMNTLTDNGGASPATISAAGIDPTYRDIKSLTIPVPTF